MSVELRRRLERGAGHRLPSTLTFNYPNIAALASFLLGELAAAEAVAAVLPAPTPPPPSTVSGLDALSDAELEARLRARLERIK